MKRRSKQSEAPPRGRPRATRTARAPASGKIARRIRVLLVDDHPVVREGLRFCLAGQPELEIVGEATNGREAIEQAQALAPDVVLMDINIPQVDGLAATMEIKKRAPQVRVLALTAHKGCEYVQRILDAGARGYVLKDSSSQELVRAIHVVHGGEPFFSPEVATELLRGIIGPSRASPLSSRERQVLTHIAEGRSNKEIADLLDVSSRTVETHRERLMNKLEIHSVARLTKYAIAHGLVSMD